MSRLHKGCKPPAFDVRVCCNGALHRIVYDGKALSFPDHPNMKGALTLHEFGGNSEYGCPNFLRLWRACRWDRIKQPEMRRALKYIYNHTSHYDNYWDWVESPEELDESDEPKMIRLARYPNYGTLNWPLIDRLDLKLQRAAASVFSQRCKYKLRGRKPPYVHVSGHYGEHATSLHKPSPDVSVWLPARGRAHVTLFLPLVWLSRVYDKGLAVYDQKFVLDVLPPWAETPWGKLRKHAVLYVVEGAIEGQLTGRVDFLNDLRNEWKGPLKQT